ncbi:unnamed protein product [Cuscuta campestris]|uniref:Uncharacterized protein n=1 Tax=Cuscuta campestris TaxID=132261 RepID=A0A484LIH2_9ASTE|nr:unnamed protein product [Cuscuta campestris]
MNMYRKSQSPEVIQDQRARLDQGCERIIVHNDLTAEHLLETQNCRHRRIPLHVSPDHGIVQERAPDLNIAENRAGVGEEIGVLGGDGEGEKRSYGGGALGEIEFEEMGMDLFELDEGFAILHEERQGEIEWIFRAVGYDLRSTLLGTMNEIGSSLSQ